MSILKLLAGIGVFAIISSCAEVYDENNGELNKNAGLTSDISVKSGNATQAQSNRKIRNIEIPPHLVGVVNAVNDSGGSELRFTNDELSTDLEIKKHHEKGIKRANKEDKKFYKMIESLGGMYAYEQFMKDNDFETIEKYHKKYGWKYRDLEREKEIEKEKEKNKKGLLDGNVLFRIADYWNDKVTGCAWHIRPQDRGTTISMNSDNRVVIDSVGRPWKSWVDWSLFDNLPSASKDGDCSALIGNWGYGDDQGGHLVASRLGGYGKRANIAPQNGNLNQGRWNSSVEEGAKTCENNRLSRAGLYFVDVTYQNSSTIRPSQYRAFLTVNSSPLSISQPLSAIVVSLDNKRIDEIGKLNADGFKWLAEQICD